jgi:hypothetical protein
MHAKEQQSAIKTTSIVCKYKNISFKNLIVWFNCILMDIFKSKITKFKDKNVKDF